MRITNLTTRAVPLSDGTILAAAGSEGSSKEVEALSDRDRKSLVERGSVRVDESRESGVGSQGSVKEQSKAAGKSLGNRPQDAGAPVNTPVSAAAPTEEKK